MSDIEQNLAFILSSRYGKNVRQAIHDSIHDCYEDGKAGAIDLVARERIDNLVANNNPTDGNSELIDIRVGFNGTTYDSAGEAVRGQVGQLSEDIVELSNAVVYDNSNGNFFESSNFTNDYWINSEGGNSPNTTGAKVYTSIHFIKVEGGITLYFMQFDRNVLILSKITGGRVVQYDESKTIINVSEHKGEIKLEPNTKYVRFSVQDNAFEIGNKNTYYNIFVSKDPENAQYNFGKSNRKIKSFKNIAEYTGSAFYEKTKTIESSSQFSRSDFIDCADLKKVYALTGMGDNVNSDRYVFNFFSDKNTESYISSDGQYTTRFSLHLFSTDVPESARYMIVQGLKNSNVQLYTDDTDYYSSIKSNGVTDETRNRIIDNNHNKYFGDNKLSTEIFSQRICVSDTDDSLGASAVQVALDEEKAVAYISYMSSNKTYGESHDRAKMTKFSVIDPTNKKHFVYAEQGKFIDNFEVGLIQENQIIFNNNEVICIFSVNSNYYYRIFDCETETFGNVYSLKFKYNNNEYDFNYESISNYANKKGKKVGNYINFTSHIEKYEGYFYAIISSSFIENELSSPILVKSINGIVWEAISVCPGSTVYEADFAVAEGSITYVTRGGYTPNMYTSNDMGINWDDGQTVESFSTRPRMIGYKKSVLSFIPVNDNYINAPSPSGRRSLDVRIGSIETNYDSRKKVITLESKYGIVYFTVFTQSDEVYLLYSCGGFFGKYQNTEDAGAAKDAVFLTRLGDIPTEEDFKYYV